MVKFGLGVQCSVLGFSLQFT